MLRRAAEDASRPNKGRARCVHSLPTSQVKKKKKKKNNSKKKKKKKKNSIHCRTTHGGTSEKFAGVSRRNFQKLSVLKVCWGLQKKLSEAWCPKTRRS